MHEQFGRYILEERIAIGGMAEIFRAKAPGLGGFEKVLAIKRLHPRYSQDADFIEMLIDEARITVELNHGNVGQIFDLGKVEDHYFIAMEFIDGRDLYRVMKRLKERGRVFPFDLAAYIGMQCAAALDYAHRKLDSRGRPLHIIHRDVSPQNVLLAHEGDVKLVDFGIAKAALRAYETESGIIKGKFYYMSPEQAKGEVLDHRTDIFSLGIVLYEMLTGDLLYKDDDEATLLSRVRRADIERPSVLRPDLPPELERIVMAALARDRNLRYPSAGHLQRDLATWLQDAGGLVSKQRLAALMRELYEPRPVPEALPLASARDDFEADDHSLISEAVFADDDETRVDTDDDTGSVDAMSTEGGRFLSGRVTGGAEPLSLDIRGTDARPSDPREVSELVELDADDIELVEDKETLNYDGPAALPDAFDSIEMHLGEADNFFDGEEDETRTFEEARVEEARAAEVARAQAARPAEPRVVRVARPAEPARAAAVARPVAAAPRAAAGGGQSRVRQSPGAEQPRAGRRGGAGEEIGEQGFNRQPTVIVPGPGGRDANAARGRGPVRRSGGHRAVAVPAAAAAVAARSGRAPRDVETPHGTRTQTATPSSWLTRERLWMGAFLVSVIIVAGVLTLLLVNDTTPPTPDTSGPVVASVGPGLNAPTPVTATSAVAAAPLANLDTAAAPTVMGAAPAVPTTAPANTSRGTLELTSFPSGAAVRIDGKWQAHLSTPATIEVPADTLVDVRIQLENYAAFDERLQIRGGEQRTLHARLERVRGTLTVESKPSGALVTIDGRDVGRTPLTVGDLGMDAAARVRVTKDGFEPFERTLDWAGRREQSLEARLEPVAAAPPVVAEAEPEPVRREAPEPEPEPVRQREPARERTRVARRDPPAPRRTRRVERAPEPDPEPIVRRSRRADPAPITRRTPRREPRRDPAPIRRGGSNSGGGGGGNGLISVKPVRGWGSVFINGALVAPESPLIGYRLPAGSHKVRLCYNGDRNRCTADRQVNVQSGGHEKVVF